MAECPLLTDTIKVTGNSQDPRGMDHVHQQLANNTGADSEKTTLKPEFWRVECLYPMVHGDGTKVSCKANAFHWLDSAGPEIFTLYQQGRWENVRVAAVELSS